MIRTIALVMLIGCGSGGSSDNSGGGGGGGAGGAPPAAGGVADKATSMLDKVKAAGDKVGGALDKLDADEVKEKLASAKTSISSGLEAAEECAWASRTNPTDESTKTQVEELKKLCAFEAPLSRAMKALSRAESAKSEQPQAPSYTECSSDDWAKAKQLIDASPFASDPKWADAKGRWTKVCGG